MPNPLAVLPRRRRCRRRHRSIRTFCQRPRRLSPPMVCFSTWRRESSMHSSVVQMPWTPRLQPSFRLQAQSRLSCRRSYRWERTGLNSSRWRSGSLRHHQWRGLRAALGSRCLCTLDRGHTDGCENEAAVSQWHDRSVRLRDSDARRRGCVYLCSIGAPLRDSRYFFSMVCPPPPFST